MFQALAPVIKSGAVITAKIVGSFIGGMAIAGATLYVLNGIEHTVDDIKAGRSARRVAKAAYYARKRAHDAENERKLGFTLAEADQRRRDRNLYNNIQTEIQRQIDAGLLVKVTPPTPTPA